MELPVYSRLGITLESGDGCRVTDTRGRSYWDFYGGHAVAVLGYNYPCLTKAIRDQSAGLIFQTNAVDVTIRSLACNTLAGTVPKGMQNIFLVNSGAEANENALRLAFMATGRKRIAAVKGAFHGRTAAAAALTYGSESWYGFPQRPFEVDWIDPSVEGDIESKITSDTAAFIFESIQGVGGAVALSDSFLQSAERRCREVGALIIADEIQAGIGRSGDFWGFTQSGIQPDFITSAKGIAGGIPAGAMLTTDEMAKLCKVGSLGTTFGGGPVACAAMHCVLTTVKKPEFLDQVKLASAYLKENLAPVVPVQGRGLMLGLRTPLPSKDVRQQLLEKGFITGDAKDPHIVRLLPPLIINTEAIDAFVAALCEVLN